VQQKERQKNASSLRDSREERVVLFFVVCVLFFVYAASLCIWALAFFWVVGWLGVCKQVLLRVFWSNHQRIVSFVVLDIAWLERTVV